MSSHHVHRVVNGKWKQNCYVISAANNEALMIDPGDEAERIADYVDEKGLTLLAILVTHGHHDHTGAIPYLKERFGVPWFVHSLEKSTLKQANLIRKVFDSSEPIVLPEPDGYFDEMDSPLDLGVFSIDVHETPGHTVGSVSFLLDDLLFTGDTLFKRAIGRVDLPGGDKQAIRASLSHMIGLNHAFMVHPGHGSSAALGSVIEINDQLRVILNEN
jgi:hydroxyacylglutathione hydrolase